MGGNDPLKWSDVFLFVMVTVSPTASALTGELVITRKNIMQIFGGARQQFLPGSGQAQQDSLCGSQS